MGVVAGIAALVSAAATAYAASKANNGSSQTQSDIANRNLGDQESNDAYSRALNALALQRSTAGTADSSGNRTYYDPSTNTWHTSLGPVPQAVQNASDNAAIQRNTTDLRTSQRANQNAELRGLLAQRAAGPALAAVNNFQPINTNQLAGLLQQRATQANNDAQRPVIQNTLRQFARTGTAAGPVLSNLERTNADTLRKTVLDDTIAAMTQGGQINNQNRQSLLNNYTSLNQQANPSLNFAPLSNDNPLAALSQQISSRIQGATTAPNQGSYASALGNSARNSAANLAISSVPNSNFAASQIGALGKQIPNITSSITDLIKQLTSGDNNNGDRGAIHYDPTEQGIY